MNSGKAAIGLECSPGPRRVRVGFQTIRRVNCNVIYPDGAGYIAAEHLVAGAPERNSDSLRLRTSGKLNFQGMPWRGSQRWIAGFGVATATTHFRNPPAGAGGGTQIVRPHVRRQTVMRARFGQHDLTQQVIVRILSDRKFNSQALRAFESLWVGEIELQIRRIAGVPVKPDVERQRSKTPVVNLGRAWRDRGRRNRSRLLEVFPTVPAS